MTCLTWLRWCKKRGGVLPRDAAIVAEVSTAPRWVQRNVAAYYPATRIHGVAVGNEVFEEAKNLSGQLVPTMANVHDALVKLGHTKTLCSLN